MYRTAIFALCYLTVVGCASESSRRLDEATTKSFAGTDRNDGSFRSGNQHSTVSDQIPRNHETKSDRPDQSFTFREDSKTGENGEQSTGFQESTTENMRLNETYAGKVYGTTKRWGLIILKKITQKEMPEEDELESTTDSDSPEICFPVLGCFSLDKTWKSPLRPIEAPESPEEIDAGISFYSRDNWDSPLNITLYPEIDMGNVEFDPSKITAIMIHGFSSSGDAKWLHDLKNAYLKRVDANVMVVDWGKGAQNKNYLQVAGNTRVVGKEVSLFIKFLINNYNADVGRIHLIGHSLGAQISSYVGKEVPGIMRLTALDPAQPGFEGFSKKVRLDKTDAEFVEVLHTDAKPFIPTLGFGMIKPHGDVDFYLNGGFDQPGCLLVALPKDVRIDGLASLAKIPVEVISKTISCPHSRSYEYLIEAYESDCVFWGQRARIAKALETSANTLSQGLLNKITALHPNCNRGDCIPMGFQTIDSTLRGVFLVNTNNKAPFCISEHTNGLLEMVSETAKKLRQ